MPDNDNDNTFDKDDALDLIIYQDLEKQVNRNNKGNGGCIGVVIFMLLLPVTGYLFCHFMVNTA